MACVHLALWKKRRSTNASRFYVADVLTGYVQLPQATAGLIADLVSAILMHVRWSQMCEPVWPSGKALGW